MYLNHSWCCQFAFKMQTGKKSVTSKEIFEDLSQNKKGKKNKRKFWMRFDIMRKFSLILVIFLRFSTRNWNQASDINIFAQA